MAEQTLSIIGLGLIGGSIGLAVKQKLKHYQIIGYDQNGESLNVAEAMGAIDTATNRLSQAISLADLIMIAVPIGAARPIFQAIAEHAKPGAIITDVASTKQEMVRLAEQHLSSQTPFVGGHPIAGSEKSGTVNARADLFYGALCVLTPTETTSANATRLVESFWGDLGLRVTRMSPEAHDRAYAAISHLPHAVAAALVNASPSDFLPLAGKGFMDTTRIAAGNPEMWRDILLSNAGNVKADLLALAREIQTLAGMINDVDRDKLLAYLTRAGETRGRLNRPTEPPK